MSESKISNILEELQTEITSLKEDIGSLKEDIEKLKYTFILSCRKKDYI